MTDEIFSGEIMTGGTTLIIMFAAALLVSTLLTMVLIPYFRNKQFGQYIRDVGPQRHFSKQGTPSMGGIAIICGVIVGMMCDGDFSADKLAVIATTLAFGLIGFIDDRAKIAKRENEGLTAKQKLALQILFSALIAVYMVRRNEGAEVFIPFLKVHVDFGLMLIPFVVFVEVAMANAVNLTDGLDGLSSSVTAIVGTAFVFIAFAAKLVYNRPLLAGGGAALAGALVGFLFYNRHPAKIFMGDTGSMALGGFLSALAIVTGMEFILPIAGLVYVAEVLSVIIQVVYFKRTGGKRFFRMAPVHHHFELGGLNEVKVVALFDVFTIICCAVAYFSVV